MGGSSRPALVAIQLSQVDLNLALVGWIEAAQLQLYSHQAAQALVLCHFTCIYQ